MWYIINNYKTPRRPFIESLQFGDNLGNTVFLEAAETLFNATSVNLYDLNDSEDLQIEVKSGKGIILCMANCLSQYWKSPFLIDLLKKLNLNILIFSVGIQAQLDTELSNLSDEVIEFLELTRYPIYVRGKTSSDYLNSIGIKNEIIGCPSIFNAKPITIKEYNNAFFQCTFEHPKELELLKFGIENNLQYIIQSEINLALIHINEPITNIGTDLHYFNKLDVDEQNKFKTLILFPTTLSEWKNMINTKNFLITTRVHGALLALELGILPLLIIIDERTKELAEYHSIPNININNCNFTNIPDLYEIAISQVPEFNISILNQQSKILSVITDLNK
jgi:polysaccharide pyruvyl transferase WcaK-like protein